MLRVLLFSPLPPGCPLPSSLHLPASHLSLPPAQKVLQLKSNPEKAGFLWNVSRRKLTFSGVAFELLRSGTFTVPWPPGPSGLKSLNFCQKRAKFNYFQYFDSFSTAFLTLQTGLLRFQYPLLRNGSDGSVLLSVSAKTVLTVPVSGCVQFGF